MAGRPESTTGLFARLGFDDTRRARSFASSPVLAELVDLDHDATGLLQALARTAEPDLALAALVRLLEAAQVAGTMGVTDRSGRPAGQAGGIDLPALRSVLAAAGEERSRLLAVLGASAALGDHLARHPEQWRECTTPGTLDAAARVADLVTRVGPDARGETPGPDALRVAYRAQLLGIAAVDLSAEDPLAVFTTTAGALADLASAALEAALVLAAEEHPDDAARCRLAIIGMGKCGGRELNYISDVDVIFVAEPPCHAEESGDARRPLDGAVERVEESDAIASATRLATTTMRICSGHTAEGTLWEVDAALRPEGKQGPLVRTLASHEAYYRRWAKTWEFQALLKARVVAGDAEVGQAYLDLVSPMVWQVASRDHFVEDVQAMRLRVEAHLPRAEADREIKLGVGGLRDIEFSAQLLQLVHGRTDETLRSPRTLDALDALEKGGYVAREDANRLATAYRFLRCLEHRIQVHKMRRTHLMPTGEADLRRLGRSIGLRTEPAKAVVARRHEVTLEVRRIHESLFYRPLLAAVARLSDDEARLTPDAARDRLAALGYRDPKGALHHLRALTTGASRTAAIQRTLLPVMLGWFAEEADPDAGLLAFRQVSESLGRTPWYLKMLRDEGRAADRLAHVLARSRYAADLLAHAPESVRMLGEATGLHPRSREAVLRTMRSAVSRKDDAGSAMLAARVVRRQELFRIALADLVGELTLDEVGVGLTDLTEALLQVALEVAVHKTEDDRGRPVPADLALVGMGRLGGREMGYGSDADLVVVHRPHEGADPADVTAAVGAVVQELRRSTRAPGPGPAIEVDLDLRPEGKNGPLSRTIEGYRTYYARWSDAWEHQALLRARPVAGEPELGEAYVEMADAVRYAPDVLAGSALRDIRRLKARMEAERLPRGADPKTHLKLGRGGLSDVEWTVQLHQLRHAHAVPDLRTTSTLPALAAAVEASLVDAGDAEALSEAWRLASAIRNASVLWRSRNTDTVPGSLRDAEAVHRILGGPPGSGVELGERYRRVARRARGVTERLFYGQG
ncbi:bifunctional [glutamine synthetase] adenylyltransferase/[glutamine synthetase]-adenylyl-L-tyrosine phosphorylase [Mobilicoccus pelagius]|uniref:Bifunctional glutamine synthetase adenylyltransferase/adenylyl-removing enzyme n=1 Tax=Mobilicoccus pelagius NBRC 104925 TaxID=1089455 RepID=H5UQ38_9MICO|nr:bifunctional [glutamine synthetase] adenylyltransferase/[glutamine synthetase]-adenylyl-L-tyrosine phosphorylase [Mobilicoccus pelagius]GAB47843.1 glutamate-ammonia-ligase adenylyltransferase [Mobilicoccus pelagius NBRC 104925]